MAISINWGTKVITVLKTDLTLIQSTPTVIYNMDLNLFRLSLKDLEDSEDGMHFPITHNHSPEVSLGGLTYARVIEIINGYTITFEDGQYAVNLIGANSNVADNVNVNQVSVRSNNSAGMISSPEIQYASYNGGVTIDTVNGTDSSLYPYGTPLYPCKTAANSYMIRVVRGFTNVYLKSDLTLTGIPDNLLDNLQITSVTGYRLHKLTIDNLLIVHARGKNLNVTGTFKDGSFVDADDCFIENISNTSLSAQNCTILGGEYSNTELKKCVLYGDIKIKSGCTFSGVNIIFEGDTTIIDMQGNPCTVSLDIDSGYFILKNSVAGCLAEFNCRGGEIELDDSCTGGDFYAEGIGTLFGDPEELGMTVKANHLIALETIPGPILDKILSEHQISGSVGESITNIETNTTTIKRQTSIIPATL